MGVSLVTCINRNYDRELKQSWNRLLDSMCDKDKELLKRFEDRWDMFGDFKSNKKKNKV
jgi:hypothetical protein